jgi:hypothetical protein
MGVRFQLLMRWTVFLLIGLVGCAVTGMAQGTFLYTWHGDSNLFQASFQVTPEENQPGAYFNSETFTSSILATSLDDRFTYHWPQDIAEGSFGPPLRVSFIFYDTVAGRELYASAYQGWALVTEVDTATSNQLWWENGYWAAVYVPEPSTASLLALAGIACGIKHRST